MSSKQLLKRIGLGLLTLWLVSLVVFAGVALFYLLHLLIEG